MKRILTLLLIAFSVVGYVASQEAVGGVVVSEKRVESTSKFTRVSSLPVLSRSSNGNSIQVQFSGNFTEEMKSSIHYAISLWNNRLELQNSIIIRFFAADLGSETAYRVVNRYIPNNGMVYSESLAQNIGLFTDTASIESTIEINRNSDFWDYRREGEVELGKVCLITAAMRSICLWMGFGGNTYLSKTTKDVAFAYYYNLFTHFDSNVLNSAGTYLNTLPNRGGRGDVRVTRFTTGQDGDVFYKYKDQSNYKLYTPLSFEDGKNLRFFDTAGDFMSVNLYTGYRMTVIDDKTVEVLRDMGWQIVEAASVNIGCDKINESKIGSAYTHYSFGAQSAQGELSDWNWKYELVDLNGNYVTITTAQSPSFLIPDVNYPELYKQKEGGFLTGKISLEATVRGRRVSTAYDLLLDLKIAPIKVTEINRVKDNVHGFFSVTLEVEYLGGSYLDVAVEQDNIAMIDNFRVNEKDRTTFTYSLRMQRTIWFDFKAKNPFDTKTYTYEIAPVEPDLNTINTVSSYRVQSTFGEYMGTFRTYEQIRSGVLKDGIYILIEQDKDGSRMGSRKIIIKE